MCWRKSLWTIALCFGLGLGLAPTVRSAHACSCDETSGWSLTLEQISAVDPTAEGEFWSSEASIVDGSFELDHTWLGLRRVQ